MSARARARTSTSQPSKPLRPAANGAPLGTSGEEVTVPTCSVNKPQTRGTCLFSSPATFPRAPPPRPLGPGAAAQRCRLPAPAPRAPLVGDQQEQRRELAFHRPGIDAKRKARPVRSAEPEEPSNDPQAPIRAPKQTPPAPPGPRRAPGPGRAPGTEQPGYRRSRAGSAAGASRRRAGAGRLPRLPGPPPPTRSPLGSAPLTSPSRGPNRGL